MKKLFSMLLVFSAILPAVKAQKATFGFTLGGTAGTLRIKSETGDASTTSSLVGFSAGVIADLPMGKSFIFQPALQFLQKGGSDDIMGGTLNVRFNDIELPLNFLYRTHGTDGHFVFGLGPTLAYGVGGNYTGKADGETSTAKIEYGSNPDQIKRFEFGGNLVAGYEWKSGFFFQALYNMGFSSHWNSQPSIPDDQESMKSNYVGLRIGYFFGGK
jgi:hypothetical protein